MLRKSTYLLGVFIVGFCAFSLTSIAQTGVLISGSPGTADPSAMLEINSGNRGLLLPRVNLVGLTNGSSPIASPATGLLVYNLGGGGVPAIGFYYWTGSSWVQLTSGGFSGAGTTNRVTKWTASNALGDSQLFDNGTQIGIGLTNPGARLTIRNGGTDPGSADDGKVLFVTGGYGTGGGLDGGIEFRHDNLSQGIGFGYNTIYATGSNADQDLNLMSRGSSGRMTLTSGLPLTINGGLLVSGTASTLYGSNARIYANNDNAGGGGIMVSDDGGFVDYNDGPVTFVGSTGLRIAGNNGAGSNNAWLRINSMAVNGNGPVFADGNGTLQKNTSCPGGWNTYDVGYNRLCFREDGGARQWPASQTFCQSLGGDICTYKQLVKACSAGYTLNARQNYWLADHDNDDAFTFINNNGNFGNCSANGSNWDGSRGRDNTGGVFCCMEYMRY